MTVQPGCVDGEHYKYVTCYARERDCWIFMKTEFLFYSMNGLYYIAVYVPSSYTA